MFRVMLIVQHLQCVYGNDSCCVGEFGVGCDRCSISVRLVGGTDEFGCVGSEEMELCVDGV